MKVEKWKIAPGSDIKAHTILTAETEQDNRILLAADRAMKWEPGLRAYHPTHEGHIEGSDGALKPVLQAFIDTPA